MWTPEDRVLVGDFGAGQASSDEPHGLVEPLIPPAEPGGRPRTTGLRRLLDGPFYPLRTGRRWRHLPPPPAFPPWQTVCGCFRAFLKAGVWERLRPTTWWSCCAGGRGREAGPTAAILDTQGVETTERGGPRGYDAAKRVRGRKRHIAVDTRGLPLGVAVHAADIQAADGAGDPLRRLKRLHRWLIRARCSPTASTTASPSRWSAARSAWR